MQTSSIKLRTRFGGVLTPRANEEPAAGADPAPGAFAVLDPHGRPAAPAGEPGFEVARANAVAAAGGTVSPLLTGYANGVPQDNVSEVVNFLAPSVPVPVVFQYRTPSLSDQLGLEDKDQVGYSGVPSTVYPDSDSLVPGQLLFRGLETPFTEQDRRLADAVLGNSAERERQRRVRFLVGAIRRGRAYRTYAAVAAAAGAATDLTIYDDNDPFRELRAAMNAVILEAGSPAYVRVLMGYSVLAGFQDHPLVNGASGGLIREVSLGMIATKLGIPEANIMVSWHQVVTAKQGKTASRAVLIGADQMYVFVCRPTPSEEDNSWMKTFNLAGQGGVNDPFDVMSFQPHPLYEKILVSYWELLKVTNSNANAVKRYAVTFTAGSEPSE